LNDIFARTTNPIEEVTFLKTNQDPEIASQRASLVDILCQDTEGNRFIVEMQVAHEPGFVERAQYYAARAYIDQRTRGSDYHDLKQVTFLAITDFVLFGQKEGYLSHHHIMDTQTFERALKDFSFSFLQLPKFTKTVDQLKTMTEKWAYFFKHAAETKEEDLDLIAGEAHIMIRAYEELNRYKWSPEELRTYDSVDMKKWSNKAVLEGALERGRTQGLVEGRTQGIAEGRAVGRAEAMREAAQNLLKQGYSDQQIQAATGLSSQEIKQLLVKEAS